jgi:hypothetical protein
MNISLQNLDVLKRAGRLARNNGFKSCVYQMHSKLLQTDNFEMLCSCTKE